MPVPRGVPSRRHPLQPHRRPSLHLQRRCLRVSWGLWSHRLPRTRCDALAILHADGRRRHPRPSGQLDSLLVPVVLCQREQLPHPWRSRRSRGIAMPRPIGSKRPAWRAPPICNDLWYSKSGEQLISRGATYCATALRSTATVSAKAATATATAIAVAPPSSASFATTAATAANRPQDLPRSGGSQLPVGQPGGCLPSSIRVLHVQSVRLHQPLSPQLPCGRDRAACEGLRGTGEVWLPRASSSEL